MLVGDPEPLLKETELGSTASFQLSAMESLRKMASSLATVDSRLG